MRSLVLAWRRRWWRRDPAALAAFEGLRPVTIVTGGSEGIGLELARRFASAGNDVMLVARRLEPLEQAAAQIRAETKADVIVLPLDVTVPDAAATDRSGARVTRRLCGRARQQCRALGWLARFMHMPPPMSCGWSTSTCARSHILTHHFLPGMRVRGRGGILNLASIGGFAPGPNQAAYYASKAYVLSLTEAIAAETAGEGVRVCALAPGPVNTRWHEKAGAQSAFYRSFVPPASARSVAWAGYLGYVLGLRVTIPGLVNPFMALAMRIMPHRIVIPIIGVLLRPRKR